MKPSTLACAWLALGLAASSGLAQAQTPVAAPAGAAVSAPSSSDRVRQFTLDNGLTVIVLPDRRAPTAVHMLWVRVGAMDEVDGTSGVAHALEHMMFKGTPTVPPGEFSKRVAALGGRENAFTTHDYTGYYQQIPAQRLEDVMRLEADRFAHSQWPDAEFAKEIEVVKEERRLRTEDNPHARLFEQLNATAYVAAPYRRPVVGWMGDLDAMTADDVRQFWQRWYVPGNAAVVVAGDVDVQQVLALAQKIYGSIPARALPPRKPRPEPEQQGLRRVLFKAPADQAYVALSFKVPHPATLAPGPALDEGLALAVLSAVLDGYPGARLDRALVRGADRVADSAGAGYGLTGRGPQSFLLEGVPAPGKTVAELEAALRAQVSRIAREGVSEAELARVKAQWLAGQVYQRDSVMSQASELGRLWVLGLPLDTDDRLIARLPHITPALVQAVAAKYFGDDQLTVAVLDPQPLAQRPVRTPPAGLRH